MKNYAPPKALVCELEMADVIIFLTDIKQGITAADSEIALMLKKSAKPVVLVCNKADNYLKSKDDSYEFYNLGLGDPYLVSASNALGIGDVLDAIFAASSQAASTYNSIELAVTDLVSL